MNWQVFSSDAFAWLEALPSSCAQLVITDPPYESLEKHRKRGTTTRLTHSKSSSNNWFATIPDRKLPVLMAHLYRILSPDSHCYVFCDPQTQYALKTAGEANGFRFWKPLIWDKVRIGMGYHYRARYECILFFEKGKRKLNDLGIADILAYPRIHGGYPTEKPVELAEVLIDQSVERDSGALVVDPFCGSGSFGVAALNTGSVFWGCDLDTTAAYTRLSVHNQTNCKASG